MCVNSNDDGKYSVYRGFNEVSYCMMLANGLPQALFLISGDDARTRIRLIIMVSFCLETPWFLIRQPE